MPLWRTAESCRPNATKISVGSTAGHPGLPLAGILTAMAATATTITSPATTTSPAAPTIDPTAPTRATRLTCMDIQARTRIPRIIITSLHRRATPDQLTIQLLTPMIPRLCMTRAATTAVAISHMEEVRRTSLSIRTTTTSRARSMSPHQTPMITLIQFNPILTSPTTAIVSLGAMEACLLALTTAFAMVRRLGRWRGQLLVAESSQSAREWPHSMWRTMERSGRFRGLVTPWHWTRA
mmetsp:Transcript_38402/g.108524  ORF Transcript_38402/g.108524 Transcript_38402/m.108524 type:complete len:238 (-) Transcript_38402:271-984(-)